MKFTQKAAALVLSGAMVVAFAPAVPSAFAADAAAPAATATATEAATTANPNDAVTLTNGTYTVPVSSDLGMFMMEPNATVVVNGDEATVTIQATSTPDGNGAPKYDAIFLGKRADAPADSSHAGIVTGTPVYAGANYSGDKTWKDSTGKIVDAYQFTFTVPVAQVKSGIDFVVRYTAAYVNKEGSNKLAGQWSGSKDHMLSFDLTKATKQTVTLQNGTYDVPVSTSFGMFGLGENARVVVNGTKATVTVTSDSAPDGTGAPKYDAIALGHHADVVSNPNVKVIAGVPLYAGAGYQGDNTWKDSTGKIVDAYQFTFDTTQDALNSGVNFVARYTGHYANKSGSTAYAGKWSGSHDNTFTFDLAKAVKVATPAKKAAKTFTVNTATVNAKAVKSAAKKAGATAKSATSITVGTKAKKISKSAFKGFAKVKTLDVKTTKLTKKSVKGSLKGSKVKTVKVPKAKKAAYKKIFTKANAGKKVTVK